ncbi:hypothetical protein BRD00_13505 [Halobacteriales archaeon QS_8_69_26]|nr:MAG: hypothetical protein BRD00_13505 [Halobacteriales archaeon QS_8_69_26]
MVTMGSGSVARRAGEAVEDRVLERTAFVHVPDGEVTWYDAETPPGFPVEIKGAVRERSKGDRTAPGL